MSFSEFVEKVTDASSTSRKPLIEIGLVLAGELDAIDREAVEVARRRAAEELQRRFCDFDWSLVSVPRAETAVSHREEPVAFLDQGRMERDVHKWDFVFVITGADLIGHNEPFALGTVSRTLDLAVLSTARIDPHAVDSSVANDSRITQIAERLGVLMLCCLGHLNGLDSVTDARNLMRDVDDVYELDNLDELTETQVEKMASNLRAVADLRLEEQSDVNSRSQVAFAIRAGWTQRGEILAGVIEAEPWQFPIRLGRLTTAAVSAMLILLMTAETWDMAMSLAPVSALGLLLAALTLTTAYVVSRQKLLVRRYDRLMTEQTVVSNITANLTVVCGLGTTLIVFFAASLALSVSLFSDPVAEGWAASVDAPITWSHYLLLSGVVSAFSLCIGALGAAFEDQSYFRHVTFMDEEL